MFTIEQSGKFKKDLKKYAHDKEKLIALNEVLKHLEAEGNVPEKYAPILLKESIPALWNVISKAIFS